MAKAQPQKVAELLKRMAVYGASADQVPPTIFWPFNETAHGVAPWNYQCPQCKHSGAQLDSQGRRHFDPWCDDVVCGVGPPAPPDTPAADEAAPHPEEDEGGEAEWYGFGT